MSEEKEEVKKEVKRPVYAASDAEKNFKPGTIKNPGAVKGCAGC